MNRNIRIGKVLRTSNDKGPSKILTVESDGKEMDVTVIEPHGFSSSPHEEGQVLIFLPDGDEGKAYAMSMPRPKDRVDQQKPDEVTLKNHKTSATLRLTDEGHIEITSGADVIIKSPGNVHINP